MTEQARQAQREYYKEWRKKNQEKIKGYNKKYWEKQAQAETNSTHIENAPVKNGGDSV